MKKELFNTKHFEEDLYKIRKVPFQKDDMHQLKELFNTATSSYHGHYNDSYGKGNRKLSHNIKEQRVTFKMSYSKTLSSHSKYITNYLVQKEKNEVVDKPVLFGTDIETYKANIDPLNFKCIISPENQNVDLKVLCNEFIKRLETLTGYKFYWEGAIHKNTEHKHAHICINGKDQNGKKVQFQKEWIRNTMREMLSYVTTQMVGERTKEEIESSKKKLPLAKRWTKLDEILINLPKQIDINNIQPELQNRIMFLNEINLAKKTGDNYYTLDTQYKDVLQATGRYNTFLDNYIELNQNLKIYRGEALQGKVIKVITFDKDEAWNDAIIVHNKNNENIYVPIWQLHKEELLDKEVKIKEGISSIGRQLNDTQIKVIQSNKSKIEYKYTR